MSGKQAFRPRNRLYLPPIAALAVFVALVVLFLLGASNTLDNDILLALRRQECSWLSAFMIFITYLGSWPVLIAGLITLGLLDRHEKGTADTRRLALALLGGGILSLVLKNLIRRPRPDLTVTLLRPEGFSFPSGHALLSLVFYLTLAGILAHRAKSKMRAAFIWALCLVLTLLIGYSRLYFGVHYLTDVLAGYAIGLAWITLIPLLTTNKNAT